MAGLYKPCCSEPFSQFIICTLLTSVEIFFCLVLQQLEREAIRQTKQPVELRVSSLFVPSKYTFVEKSERKFAAVVKKQRLF